MRSRISPKWTYLDLYDKSIWTYSIHEGLLEVALLNLNFLKLNLSWRLDGLGFKVYGALLLSAVVVLLNPKTLRSAFPRGRTRTHTHTHTKP